MDRTGMRLAVALVALGLARSAGFGGEDGMAKRVQLPQRLMTATEVLNEVYLQTGTRYAYPTGALVRQVDTTAMGGQTTVEAVTKLLAPQVSLDNGVLLLERALDEKRLTALARELRSGTVDQRRVAAYELGCTGSTKAMAPLLEALADKNESVRHHALRSLDRLERDHISYAPPGRASIFSVGRRRPTKGLVDLLAGAHHPTSHEWVWSAQVLARMPDAKASAELTKAVDHPYPRTRNAARAALAATEPKRLTPETVVTLGTEDLRDPASAAALVTQLGAADPTDRAAAARLLARRNDVGPDPLLTRLAEEQDPEVRGEMLLALGRKGGQAVWPVLLKALGDGDPVIRRAALRGLERCPDPRAVAPLMEILTGKASETDDRNLAAQTLGMIASAEVVRALTTYIEAQIAAGQVPISTAVLALAWTGEPAGVPALVKVTALSKKDTPWYAANEKGYAFTGLARVGTVEAVEALMSHYNEWDNTARYVGHAAVRLAGAWHPEAVTRYIETVAAGRGRISPHGLEEAEDPRAVDALISQLETSRGERLHFIVQALGRIGDPKIVPALIKALDHPTAWVRHEVVRALRWRWYWHRPEVRKAFERHPVFKAFVAEPPSIEDQPENTWVCRLWPIDFDDYRACNTSYEAGLVYDESTGKVVKWGSHGQRCDSPQTGETWLYDPATNTWRESVSPVEPFGMCGTWGLAYDRANRVMVSVQLEGGNHGWQWDRGRALRASVPWVYHGEEDRWVPVRPPDNPGQRGFLPLAYLDRHQVTMLYGGQGRALAGAADVCLYDAYTNTWHYLPQTAPNPGLRNHHGMVYLPKRDEVFLFGGTRNADAQTWLWNVTANAWRNAQPTGNPPIMRHTIKYDPLTGTVLAFRFDADRSTVIWQYDPEKNAWKTIPPPPEPTPHYHSVDVAYDPVHNVWVLDGGHVNWNTDHIGVREVWTYRLKKERPKHEDLPAPTDVAVNTKTGACILTWKPVAGAKGYVVYRGLGVEPWKATFQKVTDEPIQGTAFTDPAVPPKDRIAFYSVAAVHANGAEGPRSPVVRAQPPYPGDVVASVRPDRTVLVTWKKVDRPDIVGYHVYAGSIQVGDRWHMTSMEKFTDFKRLTDAPLTATEFSDPQPLAQATGLFNHEVRTYQVTAVNALGVESGRSALALTLTSSVPRVTATERRDGSTVIAWQPVPERWVRGYAVYRMDEFRGSMCVRLNPQPVTGTSYVDRPETPRAERRRYYVVAVDALNEEGLPSTGAWAFGRP